MAGPGRRAVTQVRIEGGQAQVQYAPTNLAYRISNFELTPEGTLRAVRGSCPYEPDRGGDQYGGSLLGGDYRVFGSGTSQADFPTIYGIYHAGLLDGRAPTLVIRVGSQLLMHAGWRRAWKIIYTGLTDDGRSGYPDMFAVVNGNIVWTNGVDAPLVISHDGMVVPLGYDKSPGPPEVFGPKQPAERSKEYRNTDGYSWPGRIGTIGDYVDNNDGALLASRRRYALAWEDVHGNISPLSPESVEFAEALQRANAWLQTNGSGVRLYDQGTSVDDLPRQAVVKATGDAPEHTAAVRIYRTPDIDRFGNTYRLLVRAAGTGRFCYADNVPDSRLGEPAKAYLPVPRFSIMTSHAGALVVAEGARVLRSEVGFPGTFPAEYAVTPDPDGAVVTGLASHAGRLIAFTERSMVDITDPAAPVVMARGIGCVAPRSVQGMPSGLLVWLSRDAFYGWMPEQGVSQLSGNIHRLVKNGLAKGSLLSAVSFVDPESREYRCAVARAGSMDNELILSFDGSGWKELDLGYKISDVCVTDDPRYYVLIAAGRTFTLTSPELVTPENPAGTASITGYNVRVMGHESTAGKGPDLVHEYLSAWLRADDNALQPVNVHSLYLGFVDEIDENVDVYIYSNGSYAPDADSPRPVRSVGVRVEDLLGDLQLGSGKVHARRLFWRRVPVALENVNTWAFRLRGKCHIAAFAFHTSLASQGDALGRIPEAEDVSD